MIGWLKKAFARRGVTPSKIGYNRVCLALRQAGIFVTPETALTLSAVYRAISFISQTVALLPWGVFENYQPKTGDPVHSILSCRPNPEMSPFDFKRLLTSHALSWGNGYAEIEFNRAGVPMRLWPMHPATVQPMRDDNAELFYRCTNDNGTYTDLPAWQVFHIRNLGSDGIVGYSTIGLAARSIGMGIAAEKFGSNLFERQALPGGVLEASKELSPEAAKRLQSSFDDAYSGADHAGDVIVLEDGLTFKPLTFKPEDLQFIQSRQFSVEDVARWFGLPPHKLADMSHATFCLPGDAQVLTPLGPKDIASIKEGDTVYSHDGRGFVEKPVVKCGQTGEDEIITIRTLNRTIRLNGKHRVLVRRREIQPGKTKDGRNHPIAVGVNKYVPASEIAVGDVLIVLNEINDTRNAGEFSNGLVKLCGLILSDGNVFDKKSNASVCIARYKHSPYMDAYRKIICDEFVKYANWQRGEIAPVVLREHDRCTKFSSVTAVEKLKELGMCGNSRTKSIPDWVFSLSNEQKLEFLGGCLDGDGSVDKMGRAAFHSVNKKMLSQLRYLVMSVGIPVTNLRRQEVNTKLPNGEMFKGECFSFTCSDPGKNRLIRTETPIYKERMENGKPFGKKAYAYPLHACGKDFDMPNCAMSRVVDISIGEKEPVYDLCVEETHNFIADGVVVHNSNIEHLSIEVVTDAIMPWCKPFEEEGDWKLLSKRSGNVYTKMNIRGLLRGDNASRADYYTKMLQNGVYCINDVRSLEDMAPIADGDKHLVPLNQTTIENAGKAQETAPPVQQTETNANEVADGSQDTSQE